MLQTYDLRGRTALVTGGASGIGLGAVRCFLRNGAAVAINDLPGPNLERVVKELSAEGHTVVAAPGNVGDAEDAPRMVRQAVADLGRLDYLINNAGTPNTKTPVPPSDFDRMDEAFWDVLLNVNLIGPYRCTKAAAPALRATGGAIVNTVSISAYGGGGSSSVYCATKAGLLNLTREWARALAPQVRVNGIAPGAVDSNWMCRFPGQDEGETASHIPLRRIGSPTDYGETILFLAAGADYVTGQTLIVDGGLTA